MQSEKPMTAGFWARIMAFVIDSALLSIVYWVGIFFAGAQFFWFSDTVATLSVDYSLVLSISLLVAPIFLSMTYFTLLHACGGQTIGKGIMGIKICAAEGGSIGYLRSLLRYLGYPLSMVPFCLGIFWILLSEDGQAWHDYLAKTQVVFDPV